MEAAEGTRTTKLVYDDHIVRQFSIATIVWAIVGMALGVFIALQLAFWQANLPPYLTFGRLRPVHTNAAIFAFVGNMLFAGVYYSTQRLLKTNLPSKLLGKIHFWGWQLIIVAAAITLPLGFTQGKEYAELEWPIDLAVALVWVIFAIQFFWMIKRRNEEHLYVALWFYIATIVTVTLLYVVNNMVIPVGMLKSYSAFAGVQDALVQWWYGHNAVAFFLTTPILGIMYYFVPKAAERPIYSYRLSIVHFWALVFIYIWAGPHHLLNTALPDWAQSLGMIFSLMLWAPSWGGMLNGLLTLRGAWQKLRRDPVLKFFAVGVTFYGMATFEGPLLAIKSVSSLSHYTDWIIGHVHSGTLGWNGFMAAGMLYWLVPRLYGTELYSRSAANFHFYIGTLGILFYVASMWVAGITQGLMWRAEGPDGGLMYPNFVETYLAIKLMYWARLLGGLMYVTGFVLLAWNLVKTIRAGKAADEEVDVVLRHHVAEARVRKGGGLLSAPFVLLCLVIGLVLAAGLVNTIAAMTCLLLAVILGVAAVLSSGMVRSDKPAWHRMLEGKGLAFTMLTITAVVIGGVAEIVPTMITGPRALRAEDSQPYTALQLEGRDIFLREGCYTCHSQMIRPFTWETARYGQVSDAKDSVFDHPFQWGSRRIGPDLARVGGKYPHLWHYKHMIDPREITPGSNMPPYPKLAEWTVDFSKTKRKMMAHFYIGVPYFADEIDEAEHSARREAQAIVDDLKKSGVTIAPDKQLVALIAYLQRLGKVSQPAQPAAENADAAAASGKEAK